MKKRLLIAIGKQALKAAIAVLAAALLVLFLGRKISHISETITEEKQSFTERERQGSAIEDIRRDLKRVEGHVTLIEDALLPVDRIDEFIEAVETLAETSGLSRATFAFEALELFPSLEDGITVSRVPFKLTLSGGVAALGAYVEQFERLPFFTGISSITLDAPSEEDWTDTNTSITMKAELYVR